jgi:hypothetical protein
VQGGRCKGSRHEGRANRQAGARVAEQA